MEKCFYISILVIFFSSCSSKDEEPIIDNKVLSDELVATLESVSPTGSLDYFKLDKSQIPEDEKNPITPKKVELGKFLFHETGLAIKPLVASSQLTYSCASCHSVQAGFQAGVAQGIGEGGEGFGVAGEGRKPIPSYENDSIDVQPLRSPSIINTAFQQNMLWNGSMGAYGENVGTENNWMAGNGVVFNNLGFEGLETQVMAAFRTHRMGVNRPLLETHYLDLFNQAFPDEVEGERINAINIAKAVAAYERVVIADQAPFQRWLNGETDAMSPEEIKGAKLFFSKAECFKCHTGPSLASNEFHALGMNDLQERADVIVIDTLAFNENEQANRGRASFTFRDEDEYCFKVPQIYNLKDSPFFGHGASFESVKEVIEYKNKAKKQNSKVGENYISKDFIPLELSEDEVNALTVFIEESLYDPNLERYAPTALPSGNCFPNADPVSIADLNCGS